MRENKRMNTSPFAEDLSNLGYPLPPLAVPKHRYWNCKSCISEICHGDAAEGGVVSTCRQHGLVATPSGMAGEGDVNGSSNADSGKDHEEPLHNSSRGEETDSATVTIGNIDAAGVDTVSAGVEEGGSNGSDDSIAQSHHYDNSNGLGRRKVQKVRLLSEILSGGKGHTSSDVMSTTSGGAGLGVAPEARSPPTKRKYQGENSPNSLEKWEFFRKIPRKPRTLRIDLTNEVIMLEAQGSHRSEPHTNDSLLMSSAKNKSSSLDNNDDDNQAGGAVQVDCAQINSSNVDSTACKTAEIEINRDAENVQSSSVPTAEKEHSPEVQNGESSSLPTSNRSALEELPTQQSLLHNPSSNQSPRKEFPWDLNEAIESTSQDFSESDASLKGRTIIDLNLEEPQHSAGKTISDVKGTETQHTGRTISDLKGKEAQHKGKTISDIKPAAIMLFGNPITSRGLTIPQSPFMEKDKENNDKGEAGHIGTSNSAPATAFEVERCDLNRNPADFSVPEPDNEYTIQGGNMRL